MNKKTAYFVCLLGMFAFSGSACAKKKSCAAYGKQYKHQVETVKEDL